MAELPASSRPVATVEPADPVEAAFKREQVLFTKHRYDQALTLLTELLARPDLKAHKRFEALCRKAECLEHLNRPRAAVDLLREITRAHPDESLGYSLLGEYLYRVHDDCPAALRALGRALVLNPKDADTLWWRGQVWHQGLADLARARRSYVAALEADSRHASAMDSMAALCEAEGRWIEAIDWRKRHYLRTRQATDLTALADLYLRLENVHAAMKYARSAVRRAPRSAAAWLQCAKAHATGRRFTRAEDALRRFARLANPASGPFLFSRDFGYLEPLQEHRPGLRALLDRLPTQ